MVSAARCLQQDYRDFASGVNRSLAARRKRREFQDLPPIKRIFFHIQDGGSFVRVTPLTKSLLSFSYGGSIVVLRPVNCTYLLVSLWAV